MITIQQWIETNLGFPTQMQGNLFSTLLIIFFLWLVRKIILKVTFTRITDVKVQYRWRKVSTYINTVIGTYWIVAIWFKGLTSISTFFGLLSAGIAIALQDLLVNLAGWAFIISRRPFRVGDRIQIGEIRGDVIDLRIFMFSLMEVGNWVDADQSTGRIIHVPNGKIFKEHLANYSEGFEYLWDEIPVLLTFESDWRKAKKILQQISEDHAAHLSEAAEKKVKEAARKFMIFYNKLTPIIYTNVKDSGVLLTIRYLCEPRNRRHRQEAIWEDILDEFAKHVDIDFAYPTQRFFNHFTEGKEALAKKSSKIPTDRNKPTDVI